MAEGRERSISQLSHKEYLETLHAPTTEEWHRIGQQQLRKESEIDSKYHRPRTDEEKQAATTIQKAYRGHRERRQQSGLMLDPSSRWTDVIRQIRYRTATAPHETSAGSPPPISGRTRAMSNAQRNWQRAAAIVEHAAEGGSSDSGSEGADPGNYVAAGSAAAVIRGKKVDSPAAMASMNLDLRYFLEMVDQRHRYGTNLQVYHEEWIRSKSDKNFFYWLDLGDGKALDLPICSRARLDRERIRYLSKDERKNYLAVVDKDGRLRWDKTNELITTSMAYKDSMDGIVRSEDSTTPVFSSDSVQQQLTDEQHFAAELAKITDFVPPPATEELPEHPSTTTHIDPGLLMPSVPFHKDDKPEKPTTAAKHKHLHISGATILNHLLRKCIRPGTWIYVSDTQGRLYVGIKSSGAFQHTSFLAGARISSAGSIGIEDGRLTYLAPLSGHYRPTISSFKGFVAGLRERGVDLERLRVSHAYEVLLTMEMYGRAKERAQGKKIKKKGKTESRSSESKSEGGCC